MQQPLCHKLCHFIVSVALLPTICGIFTLFSGVVSAHAAHMTFAPTSAPHIHNVTCTTSDNQDIYVRYSSIRGEILFRVGYEDAAHNRGYGYCHVLAGHPDALSTIEYVLTYGVIIATTPTSFTVRGEDINGKQYQIYIVSSNNGMTDGQMRGIVSAYQYTGH
ncbi:MAG TPA: hypothetical protein VKR06_35765 [Ktedonosporobacter sp.]|nr:hypothetical protein [Ktedonosporobacter sp.]